MQGLMFSWESILYSKSRMHGPKNNSHNLKKKKLEQVVDFKAFQSIRATGIPLAWLYYSSKGRWFEGCGHVWLSKKGFSVIIAVNNCYTDGDLGVHCKWGEGEVKGFFSFKGGVMFFKLFSKYSSCIMQCVLINSKLLISYYILLFLQSERLTWLHFWALFCFAATHSSLLIAFSSSKFRVKISNHSHPNVHNNIHSSITIIGSPQC